MARSAVTTEHEEQATRPNPRNCVHHWSIESPNGRESLGVCKRCGAKRQFSNSTESVMWEQTNTLRSDASRSSMRTSKMNEVALADES